MPGATIQIKNLYAYSLTRDGKVYRGEKEVVGIWAGVMTYQFPLTPTRNTYPNAYSLEELYKATYGEMPANIKTDIRDKSRTNPGSLPRRRLPPSRWLR